MNPPRLKIRKTTLKTPQLGVTKWSPVPPIENQNRAVGRNQIGERDFFAVLVRQRERRRFFADARGLRRKGHLAKQIKNLISKKHEREQRESGKDRAKDFTAINLRSSKSADETSDEQDSTGTKQQKIRPRKIAGDRKLGEEFVREQAANGD